MFLLTDTTMSKASGGAGFYVMAWLPLAVIIVFGIKLALQKKKKDEA